MKNVVWGICCLALLTLAEKYDVPGRAYALLSPWIPAVQTTMRATPDRGTPLHDAVAAAYANGQSNIQVQGNGRVSRVLADDNDGSRHQRFIVELASGQTLLVAHNIDLAPRIPNLGIGDNIGFSGEYEWNNKGGVLHWTHHDPSGRHQAGWLQHNGIIYR